MVVLDSTTWPNWLLSDIIELCLVVATGITVAPDNP